MMIKEICDKILGIFSEFLFYGKRKGWLRALSRLFAALVDLLYCRKDYLVLAYSLKDFRDSGPSEVPIRMFQAGQADLEALRGWIPPSEFSRFSFRLSRDRMLFLAMDGTRPAGYCWAVRHVDEKIDQIRIDLSPDDAYGVDAYTFPNFRRQGVQTGLQRLRLRTLKSQGVQRLLVIVERGNPSSLYLLEKVGFRIVNDLAYRRWLWRRDYRYRHDEHRVSPS